jgi:hypothetical protein
MKPVVVLWSQTKDRDRTVLELGCQGRVLDKILDCKGHTLDPELGCGGNRIETGQAAICSRRDYVLRKNEKKKEIVVCDFALCCQK